jgi:uncharacterized membrane protein
MRKITKEGKMAFCANCGAKVGENDKFCGSCGATRVPGAPAGQVPPPPPPPPPPVYQSPPPQVQMPPPVYSQPAAGTSGDSSTGLKANIAGLLCYLGGWVTGIIFLVIEKKSSFVKFHAAQSIVVFGTISILNFFLGILLNRIWFLGVFLNAIIGLAAFILWVYLMYKAYQGQTVKLPIAGDIAQGIVGKVQI